MPHMCPSQVRKKGLEKWHLRRHYIIKCTTFTGIQPLVDKELSATWEERENHNRKSRAPGRQQGTV